EVRIRSASRAEYDALEERVSSAMMTMGGRPAGLMVNMVRPDNDGFLITAVWRTEPEMRRFYEEAVVPALAELGLNVQDLTVWPVWGFARP
ncbi:MAG TPA: hypothetical protein VNT27_15075, partial [Propionibacteriaceae bacterium]|nr:hypothetical protein [Propionibacteriaceae bacterium]